MNILIIKLSSLGDVIQAIPTFECLRRHYPGAHISWLVEEESADLLVHYPGLDEVLVWRRHLWTRQLCTVAGLPATVVEMLRFCRQLRRRYYDLVIDLQGLLKSGAWVALARGARKIGFDRTREASWWFLNERLPAYDPDRHALERYLDVARYLGIEVNSLRFQPPWTREEEEICKARLREIGATEGGPLIACHPRSRWPTKLWPEAHFARLARLLVKRFDATVIFTGIARDQTAVSRIIHRAAAPRIFNWAGRTNLRELGCLYKQAAAVVAVDSGPMHLAAALGTPVVALFGPTAPWRTGPYGNGHKVLRADLDCSPCFQKSCDTSECMAVLEVDGVLHTVAEQLRK